MLGVICGNIGSGKTLLLTIFAKETQNSIVSNYTLKQIKFKPFSLQKFADIGSTEYDNHMVLIDEIYTLIDSRNPMSAENKIFSYCAFQSRKKNNEIWSTLQLTRTIDVRIREIAQIVIEALGLQEVELHDGSKLRAYQYICYGITAFPFSFQIPEEYAQQFYQYYNTNEVIEPVHKDRDLHKLKSEKEQNAEILQIAQKIIKEYDKLDLTIHTYDVKDYLKEHLLPSYYEEFVWAKIRKIQRLDKKKG